MKRTMMQVELSQFGSPDELKLVERKIPLPKSGEVIIKTEAIGVNYADILRRRNQYFQLTTLSYALRIYLLKTN